MKVSSLLRLAAIGLIIGTIVTIITVSIPQSEDVRASVASPFYYPFTIATLIAGIMIMVSWPAVYLLERGESGILGFLGMLVVFASGVLLTVGIGFAQLLVFPWLATLPISNDVLQKGPEAFNVFFPITTAVVTLGGILFAWASIRAKVYPIWASVLFIVLILVSFVLGFLPIESNISEAFYMLGLLIYGYFLFKLSDKAGVLKSVDRL